MIELTYKFVPALREFQAIETSVILGYKTVRTIGFFRNEKEAKAAIEKLKKGK
jgi:rRNA processing protein Krr1/Pno1